MTLMPYKIFALCIVVLVFEYNQLYVGSGVIDCFSSVDFQAIRNDYSVFKKEMNDYVHNSTNYAIVLLVKLSFRINYLVQSK